MENLPSPALAGFFKVIGIVPGEVESIACGRIDLRTITLEKARLLAARGFPYLQAVAPEPAPTTQGIPAAPAKPRRQRKSAAK